MSNIVLSIVIPTYNRAQLLKGLLDSIIQDINSWPSDIELILSDNASTDDTRKITSDFIKRGIPIKYFVNPKNVGADGNVAGSFNLASGKYLWVIGDDEIMYQGTFNYVLELCRTREFGILHISSKGFSHGQQAKVSSKIKPQKVDIETLDSKTLFRRANVFLTFISANVINRNCIINNEPDFNGRAELNSYLPQLSWTYSALKCAETHYYIKTPLFGALAGNTGGYKLVEVFGVNLINITKKYLMHVIPNAERIMTNAVLLAIIPGGIMSQYSNSNVNSRFQQENISEVTERFFKDYLYYRLFIRPILSNSILKRKLAYFFVRVANKINNKLMYFFL